MLWQKGKVEMSFEQYINIMFGVFIYELIGRPLLVKFLKWVQEDSKSKDGIGDVRLEDEDTL